MTAENNDDISNINRFIEHGTESVPVLDGVKLDPQEIIKVMRWKTPKDLGLVIKAFKFAEKAHGGQTRFSGEQYFIHAFSTGKNLAELGLDSTTIAGGLLHDTLEDGRATEKQIKAEFGSDILFLVQGATKLSTLKYRGLERHAENLRRLFVAMSKDIRVLFIKLADRLHNIRTIEFVRPDKQKRIAIETIEIFARLADRLGLGKLKEELEDKAFPFAYPDEYVHVKELLERRTKENRERLEKTYRSLRKEFAKNNWNDMKVNCRIKGLYSTYKKLQEKGMDIEKIYDIAAIRVITPTIERCYQALGLVHSNWQPVPGRFKDYLATPKPNGYQSLHTTIFTGDGGLVEIQIRTARMHEEAEFGVASRIAYNESGKPTKGGSLSENLEWIKNLLNWQKMVSSSSPEEFVDNLKTDIFHHQIFVFTPRGDVIELPNGSTPVDFAYAIHSDIGDHMVGAKINEKFVTLDSKIKNGDVIEILTKKNATPREKWIEHAQAAITKRHIRAGLAKLRERPSLNR